MIINPDGGTDVCIKFHSNPCIVAMTYTAYISKTTNLVIRRAVQETCWDSKVIGTMKIHLLGSIDFCILFFFCGKPSNNQGILPKTNT